MSYNRAFDKIASAVLAYRAGSVTKASALFASACTDSSVRAALEAIERTNARAFKQTALTRLRAAEEDTSEDEDDNEVDAECDEEEEAKIQARRIRARRLRRASIDDDSAGIPMNQVGDDFRIEPEVEEADTNDLFLDEDGGELDMEADSEDFAADPEDTPSLNTSARFKRALANMRASTIASAKKKVPAKKKPVMKRK